MYAAYPFLLCACVTFAFDRWNERPPTHSRVKVRSCPRNPQCSLRATQASHCRTMEIWSPGYRPQRLFLPNPSPINRTEHQSRPSKFNNKYTQFKGPPASLLPGRIYATASTRTGLHPGSSLPLPSLLIQIPCVRHLKLSMQQRMWTAPSVLRLLQGFLGGWRRWVWDGWLGLSGIYSWICWGCCCWELGPNCRMHRTVFDVIFPRPSQINGQSFLAWASHYQPEFVLPDQMSSGKGNPETSFEVIYGFRLGCIFNLHIHIKT